MRRGEGSGEEGLLPKPHLHPPPGRKRHFSRKQKTSTLFRGKPVCLERQAAPAAGSDAELSRVVTTKRGVSPFWTPPRRLAERGKVKRAELEGKQPAASAHGRRLTG